MQRQESITRDLESPIRSYRKKNGGASLLCSADCPNLARIQELESELAYYKNRCYVYENRSNLVNHSSIRMSIQRVEAQFESGKGLDSLEKVDINRDNREKLLYFSRRIDERMRNREIRSSKPNVSNVRSLGSYTEIIKSALEEESREEVGAERTLQPHPFANEEVVQSRLNIKETLEYQPSEKFHQKLISDLCIFGLKPSTIVSLISEKDAEPRPELVYSLCNLFDEGYYGHTAYYLLPFGLHLKRVKKEKRLQEINSIMFQNHKKQSNYIYALNAKELDLGELSREEKELLAEVNPSRKMFCICIRINEFTMVECKAYDELSVIVESEHGEVVLAEGEAPKPPRSPARSTRYIYSSKRVLAIFTLYPFFEFFESVLITLFNELKIERLNIFQNNMETVERLDSEFINRRLAESYNKIIESFNRACMVHNYNFEFVFGGDLLRLSTYRGQLAQTNLAGWVFPVLRMFSKDTFYEVLLAVLLEYQVVFVCYNLHILTYTIYLFTEVLTRPFEYPHSSVYILVNEEFLDAVTPIVVGVGRSAKWLQEHYDAERDTKTYVLLADEVVLHDHRKEKRPRNYKLRKIVKDFYKPYDKGLTLFKKKKEEPEYFFNATKEEKEQCLYFVNRLNYFFDVEFAREVPNAESVKVLSYRVRARPDFDRHDEATMLSEELQKDILRGKKDKDPFTERFMKTQLFLNYFFEKIGFE